MVEEARKCVEGSLFALFGIPILCLGVGILIHIVMDHTLLSSSHRADKSGRSISTNMNWFEFEDIRKIVAVMERHNKDMHPQLKRDIAHEIYRMTIRYPNLDADIICDAITYSSRKTWDPKILSSTGVLGLMGIRPEVGELVARCEGIEWTTKAEVLLDPIYNIRIGARYLSTLIGRFGFEKGLLVYLMDQKGRRRPDKVHNGVYYRRSKRPSRGVRDGETT